MNREQLNIIEDMINYIDAHITQPLALDILSRQAGVSKFYLDRLFKTVTNKSLMTYVRDRRLSISLQKLLKSDMKILDIALEYQFEYEQSYCRAFKKKFNMTPNQYRTQKCELAIDQKYDTGRIHKLRDGIVFEPYMCIKDKLILQGLESEIFHSENYTFETTNIQAEKFRDEYLNQMKNVIDKNVYFGLVRYSAFDEISSYYLSGVQVTQKGNSQLPLSLYVLDSHEYAVFRYIGLHSPHRITFKALCTIYNSIDWWKENSSYTQAAPYHFEYVDLAKCSDEYCEMDIYVPIKAN